MGHSMGGQIAGFLGQGTNGELNTIIGLDPAGPLYFENLPDSRLSADDAKYVQGIHTNAALKGVNFNVGVIDFWPNGGYLQAGCGTDILGSCSHRRAFEYMAESIESNRFYARLCDSYNNYLAQSCINNTQARMGGPKYDKT
ncbi:hypothetical protein GWI33_019723 [Rhynchophorus ferrugineus]|uniref:Lipase domain-containing protein n=1 Tax=Rhynchophorus ferrugineus TaxID=354439 RepID=A0A834HQW6_RHYFE|nr:hypothetical protein GWI33_019723 [Rhynchophorus ferrugineus]